MSTGEIETRRDRLEMLLPFYLNGTLSDAERVEVEEWLASDPAGAIALEEAEAEYSATAIANEEIRPPADALSRLSAALEREAGVERSQRASWLQRGMAWFNAVPPGLAWATAALAVAILAGQTAWIRSSTQESYSVAGTEEQTNLPFVLVSFAENATVGDVSNALQELELKISAGPLPDGMYRVTIPAQTGAEYDQMVARLQGTPLVVWILAGRRPGDG